MAGVVWKRDRGGGRRREGGPRGSRRSRMRGRGAGLARRGLRRLVGEADLDGGPRT